MTVQRDFQSVRIVEIDPAQHGQRIDNFLLGQLGSVPRSVIYRILRTGQVRVNKGRIKPAHRLQTGDMVRIPPVSVKPATNPSIPSAVVERLVEGIIESDDDYIVLNKAAGIAVHGGSGVQYGVIDVLRQYFSQQAICLVHRLDKNTSGVLVAARHRPAAVAFQQALQDNRVRKSYQALLGGCFQQALEVSLPLAKISTAKGEQVQVNENGKPALSFFEPLMPGELCSLVGVRIETGRTHQIRVHAAHQQLPVLGDDRYGDWPLNRRAAKLGYKRMYLHASELAFPSFASGRDKICVATPVDDWQAVYTDVNRSQ